MDWAKALDDVGIYLLIPVKLSLSTPALGGDVQVPIDLLQHWKEGLGISFGLCLHFPIALVSPALGGDVQVPKDALQHWKEGLGKSFG